MTSGQRKAHKIIWLLLVITVPLVIIFAIRDLTVFIPKNNKNPQEQILKEKPLNVFENDLIKASLYDSYIQIILKVTLKNASSLVYEMNARGIKSNVIGQLTTAGIYKFNINNLPKGIIVFDELKKVEITKFSFKWD
jgi:hypothetical protein